jgi:hypothetical protein
VIGALGALGIVFYALIYSGVQELKGLKISTLDALLGREATVIANRVSGGTTSGARTGTATPLGGECKDAKGLVSHPHVVGVVRLIPSAMQAFVAAEKAYGGHIPLVGSYRSCASQVANYASDPGRFAPPGSSAHPMGRAIDVARHAIDAARPHLLAAGWRQSRSDEPWHFSHGITA